MHSLWAHSLLVQLRMHAGDTIGVFSAKQAEFHLKAREGNRWHSGIAVPPPVRFSLWRQPDVTPDPLKVDPSYMYLKRTFLFTPVRPARENDPLTTRAGGILPFDGRHTAVPHVPQKATATAHHIKGLVCASYHRHRRHL